MNNFKPHCEQLEDRLTPANPLELHVNNGTDTHKEGNDPATGLPYRTLRECMDLANMTPNVMGLEDNIFYDAAAFDANNDCITNLGAPLPTITEAV